jgi:Flp pilus assembly protein TadD
VLGADRATLGEGVTALRAYVAAHPADATGHFNLALLLSQQEQAAALDEAGLAVRLAPSNEPAHFLRAWLLEQTGSNAGSIAELAIATRLDPHDARAYDLLGVNHLAAGAPAEAERALRRALELAPGDEKALLHYSRALIELGRKADAAPYLERFRKARELAGKTPHASAGLIESATLSPGERAGRVAARFREALATQPNDAALRQGYGAALLELGDAPGAAAAYRELLALNPPPALALTAGRTLLAHGQPALARELLERAIDEPGARVDLAAALWLGGDAARALSVLEAVPDAGGDAMLARALVLDALGRAPEADAGVEQARRAGFSRPALAARAALLLERHGRGAEALELLDDALRRTPDEIELLLTRAVIRGAEHDAAGASAAIRAVEARWPEAARPYAVEALLLARAGRMAEARQRADIALALDPGDAAARCLPALFTPGASSPAGCAAPDPLVAPLWRNSPAR